MRRPLCLFVLSFACISFLLQMTLKHSGSGLAETESDVQQSKEMQYVQQICKIQEWKAVCISGQLQKKEEKNGNLIYYLKDVHVLEPAKEPGEQVENQSKYQSITQSVKQLIVQPEKQLSAQSKKQSAIQSTNQKQEQFQPHVLNTSLSDISLGVVCYMETKDTEAAYVGQWLLIRGTASFYERAENAGQFDARSYYEGLGYHFKLYNGSVEKRGVSYDKLEEWLLQKKQKLRQFLEENMKEDNAGILTAMLLGDKTAMDGEIKTLYQKSGIAHVLAISGLHISLLGMLFYRFLRRCFLPSPVCCSVGISVILLYGKMTGFSASSFRAICMFIVFLLADLLNRSYDLLTAMALAAFLSFLKEPEILFEAGFLLSYLAVIGLAVVNPVLKRCFYDSNEIIRGGKKLAISTFAENKLIKIIVLVNKFIKNTITKKGIAGNSMIKKLTDSILASVSTQIMIFPVLLWFYYEFSLYSLLLNLIVIPCVSVILLSGVAGCVTGIPLCLFPADILLDLYEWLCTCSRSLPHSLIITGRPAVWQMVLYYGLVSGWLFLNWVSVEKKQKTGGLIHLSKLSGPIIPVLCMFLFFIPVHRENRVDFLSVGQGDCACMRDEKGNVILVDGGSSDVDEAGKYRLIPFLKYHGISYVNAAFVSHAHEDHYSAIVELLEEGKEEGVKVGAVCISAYGRGREEYKVIVTAAKKAGAEIIYIQKGDEMICGNMKFFCLYPARDIVVADENDASLILYGEYRIEGNRNLSAATFSVLFTGDSTQNCEGEIIEALKQKNINKISLLKVAHHGSRESTGEALLKQTNPAVAVISCGRDNSYGHPHSETLERLDAAGSRVLTTPEYGAIAVEFGQKLEVRSWLSRIKK